MAFLNKFSARNPYEPNRVSTPLELFFDLVYVVAIASAGVGLHNMLQQQQQPWEAVLWYGIAFFTIWWCWMNFTWYASAYDNDNTFFRLITFLQIFGALVFAVGISNFFTPEHNLAVSLTGYVIMRIAMVIHWFRAAKFDRERRNVCLRYAIAIAFVQFLWVLAFIFLKQYLLQFIITLGLCELAVPIFAEKNYSVNGTPWHPHHIAERYSLLVIIVLGEGILATTNTIASLVNIETRWQEAFPLGFAAAGLIFALWWSYFQMPFPKILHQNKKSLAVSFLFGYGHFIVFAALAAVGVGLQIVADRAESLTTREFNFSTVYALLCVAIPCSVYLMMMSFYRTFMIRRSKYNWLSWLVAITVPSIPVVVNHFGLKLEWALWFLSLAPIAFIVLNRFDDCSNENAKNFEIS